MEACPSQEMINPVNYEVENIDLEIEEGIYGGYQSKLQ